MSASRPANMRGPRLKTPLLLLLLLLTTRTGTVFGQEEDEEEAEAETQEEEPEPEAEGDVDIPTEAPDPDAAPDPSPSGDTTPELGNEEEDKLGSGDEEKKSRSFEPPDGEISPTGTPNPDDVTVTPEETQDLSLIIILIPVVLVVLVIAMIVCGIFINRRWNQKGRSQELGKEDPYLDGSSTEKVPMPMFEEDVPSVLELEMEELDQWMQKDGDTPDNLNP